MRISRFFAQVLVRPRQLRVGLPHRVMGLLAMSIFLPDVFRKLRLVPENMVKSQSLEPEVLTQCKLTSEVLVVGELLLEQSCKYFLHFRDCSTSFSLAFTEKF